MFRKLIAHNPARGLKQWFIVDDQGMVHVETTQEVQGILDHNVTMANAEQEGWKGDMHRVASIPHILLDDLMRTGQINDPKAMKTLLNDPDYRKLRTKHGRV